jgi:hypothetical protein
LGFRKMSQARPGQARPSSWRRKKERKKHGVSRLLLNMMTPLKNKLLLSFFISIPEGCKRIKGCNCNKNTLTYLQPIYTDGWWWWPRMEGRKSKWVKVKPECAEALDSSSSFPSLTSYFTLLNKNKEEYSRGLLLDLHKLLLMLLAVMDFQFDVGNDGLECLTWKVHKEPTRVTLP